MRGKPKETWIQNKWRPAMAWSYLVINLFDFVLGPIMYAMLQFSTQKMMEWHPLTLGGGGLFHIAMLTIIGATAWGRTQEKIQLTTSMLSSNSSISTIKE